MKKEEFFEKVFERISAYYGDSADVSAHEVCKNNGLKKYGVCVRKSGSNCAPTIYLNDLYQNYMGDENVEAMANAAIGIFNEHLVDKEVDVSFFEDIEKVLPKICFKLISGERNAERLQELPHRMIGDIAVVYMVFLEFIGESGSILITNEHADMWDVSEEDLYEAAMDNTPRLFPAACCSMWDFCAKLAKKSAEEDETAFEYECDDEFMANIPDDGFIVATNNRKLQGSAVILYPGLLKEVAEKYNSNFYIIPSSIHETILLPEKFAPGIEELKSMIREVNNSCVPDEDFLSNSVYYYDREDENNVKKVEQASGAMVL
ncbi:DUF5688 family protein [Butyrivibrio sp. WCD3002]|uniref:DUF5688 family protein n=1 Tax=Butyrivibrio sp. WCD3002 TaxID=1280676 RepID=UPI000402AC97|nr:DUF5688 family protein [Butyrivibrio sp. WCD3002]